ncbi:MAG: YeeE/YedE thiosulfate transporter family protein [Pelagibacteraceae bacterium]
MVNFTPLSAFIGGLLIGYSALIFYLLNGRIAGISGILSNIFLSKTNWVDNVLFTIGIIIGPFLYKIFINNEVKFSISTSVDTLIIAGLLVGFGTKLGGGCTSGHGVCGIGRLSPRSIVATLVFMLTAILTVFVKGLVS